MTRLAGLALLVAGIALGYEPTLIACAGALYGLARAREVHGLLTGDGRPDHARIERLERELGIDRGP